jgi:hypothetical protein
MPVYDIRPLYDRNGLTVDGHNWFNSNLHDYLLDRLEPAEAAEMNTITVDRAMNEKYRGAQEALFEKFLDNKLSPNDRADFRSTYIDGRKHDPHMDMVNRIVFMNYVEPRARQLHREFRSQKSVTGRVKRVYRSVLSVVARFAHHNPKLQ